MKKEKNGFMATSLLYSFFLLFIAMMLTMLSNYAHNRLLVRKMNAEYQTELSSRLSFGEELQTNKPNIFNYTGSLQMAKVTRAGYYQLELWGASGGNQAGGDDGSRGGYARGSVYLNVDDKLYVYVGGRGGDNLGIPGFNGGGSGGDLTNQNSTGGGGASDIRINIDSLYARVIVAGGGAGGGVGTRQSGYGGGLTGGTSTGTNNHKGTGGTQTQPGTNATLNTFNGSFGMGGSGLETVVSSGGGGGFFGGAAGHYLNGGGGGGSGFLFTASTLSYTNESYTGGTWLLDSKYYLKNTSLLAGNQSIPTHSGLTTMLGNDGNGYIKITYKGASA